MRKFAAICVTSLGLALFPLAAQDHGKVAGPEQPKHPDRSDPQAIEAGRKQFANGCAACHGGEGQGGRGPNLRERLRSDELTDDLLFDVIQKGVKGGGMPGANLAPDDAWRLVAFLRAFTAPAAEGVVPGDATAGETVFRQSAGCVNCHAIRGEGGKLGPDLTNAGGRLSLPQLRDAILHPDDNPVPGYMSATVTLRDGRTLKGVARNRTNYSVQLQEANGKLHLLRMSEISELALSKRSAMPDDYGKRLSKDQLENVLAYLSRQTARPVESAKK